MYINATTILYDKTPKKESPKRAEFQEKIPLPVQTKERAAGPKPGGARAGPQGSEDGFD